MSAPPTPLPPASAAAPDRPRALATMARNAAIFALGEGALKVLTALLAPWFTVLLTPYAFGVWGLGAMVQNLLLPVLGLGLHGAMTRLHFDSADAAERRRLQGTLVTFQLLWGAAVCALLLATAPWWQPLLLPGLGLWPTLTLVVAGALLSQIAALPVATWTAEERAGTIVGWRTASSLAYLAAAIALVAGLEAGVDGVFAARLLGALVLVAPVLAWLRRLPWGIDGPTLRPALAFGLPLVPHLLAHWALAMADRGMIEHMLGTAAVGIYSAAYIVPDTVQLVSVAVNGAYVPVANRWIDSREGGAVLTRAATGFAAVVVVAALAAAILAPPVLRWVLDDRYAAAAPLARVLAIGGGLQGLYLVYVGVLFARKHSARLPLFTVAAGAVNVALNLWWIPAAGLVGAAWATVVGYAVLLAGVAAAVRAGGGAPVDHRRLGRLAALWSVAVLLAGPIDGAVVAWVAARAPTATAAAATGAAGLVVAAALFASWWVVAPGDREVLRARLAARRRRGVAGAWET